MLVFRYLTKNLFTAPYRLLPLAVFAFFGFCFLLHPFSPLRTAQLSDPDDYMRLNEVINWIAGQGWYDLGHPRLSPGAHTIVHWSRLVDLPIALLMLPLVKFFGLQNAALIASFVVPPALFGLLLALVPALARPFVGEDRANLASVFLLFALMVLFNFAPGRVDHHGYQILIAGFGLYCLERIINDPRGGRFAVMAAIAFACGLWIGTEALPWLLIFIACLALLSAWHGGILLRNAAVFGGAFAAAAAVVLPLALPASEFSSRALSWFSAADVIFAALTGAVFILSWLLGQETKNRVLRLGLIASLGFYALALFVYFVPDALIGPFADYDNFNSTTALENIGEAQPLAPALAIHIHNPLTYIRAFTGFTGLIMLPLAALIVIGWQITTAKRRERDIWFVHGAFLMAATLLTLFWQIRVGYFMQLFAIAPLTWLLCASWKKIGDNLKGRPRFWAETGVFCLLGLVPVVLLPALFQDTKFYPDMVLFPAARGENTCAIKPVADYLNRRYGHKNITILAGMNEGPELLFRTPYKVIAANFNVAGNQDVFDFFNARDDQTAQKIVRKWHADIILTCRNIAPFLAGMDHPKFGTTAFIRLGKDGKLHLTGSLAHPALLEKLVNGKAPTWLKPVEIPANNDYLLFEIGTGNRIK